VLRILRNAMFDPLRSGAREGEYPPVRAGWPWKCHRLAARSSKSVGRVPPPMHGYPAAGWWSRPWPAFAGGLRRAFAPRIL